MSDSVGKYEGLPAERMLALLKDLESKSSELRRRERELNERLETVEKMLSVLVSVKTDKMSGGSRDGPVQKQLMTLEEKVASVDALLGASREVEHELVHRIQLLEQSISLDEQAVGSQKAEEQEALWLEVDKMLAKWASQAEASTRPVAGSAVGRDPTTRQQEGRAAAEVEDRHYEREAQLKEDVAQYLVQIDRLKTALERIKAQADSLTKDTTSHH